MNSTPSITVGPHTYTSLGEASCDNFRELATRDWHYAAHVLLRHLRRAESHGGGMVVRPFCWARFDPQEGWTLFAGDGSCTEGDYQAIGFAEGFAPDGRPDMWLVATLAAWLRICWALTEGEGTATFPLRENSREFSRKTS